jgi:hypothetical protein
LEHQYESFISTRMLLEMVAAVPAPAVGGPYSPTMTESLQRRVPLNWIVMVLVVDAWVQPEMVGPV